MAPQFPHISPESRWRHRQSRRTA